MKPFLFVGLSLLTVMAQGAQSLNTKIHHQYESMRALGMGNAFTAVADDYSLIYYNPAGFANKRANEVQFSLVGAAVSPKTLTLMDEIKKASDTQGTDEVKATAISNVLEQYYGKALGGKVQAVELFWVRKNWGISLLPADVTIDLTIDRQFGPAIDINVKGDSTLAFGYGKDITPYFAAGATAKYVHRVSIEQSVSAIELASDSNVVSTKRAKEGQLIDFDLGFMWTPNWFGRSVVKDETAAGLKIDSKLPTTKPEDKKEEVTAEGKADNKTDPKDAPKAPTEDEKRAPQAVSDDLTLDPVEKVEDKPAAPAEVKKTEVVVEEKYKDNLPLTLSLVVRNVLGGKFSQSKMVNKDATEKPTEMYRVVDVGSQYVLGEWGSLTIRSMVDFKDLFHPELTPVKPADSKLSLTLTRAFHAGVEFDYSPSGWFKTQLRAGLNQSYYTAGATFLLGVLNIDAVTYGEEVGTVEKKIENRVYGAKVAFNF